MRFQDEDFWLPSPYAMGVWWEMVSGDVTAPMWPSLDSEIAWHLQCRSIVLEASMSGSISRTSDLSCLRRNILPTAKECLRMVGPWMPLNLSFTPGQRQKPFSYP